MTDKIMPPSNDANSDAGNHTNMMKIIVRLIVLEMIGAVAVVAAFFLIPGASLAKMISLAIAFLAWCGASLWFSGFIPHMMKGETDAR